jgi:selenide,water dikinase
LFAAQMQLKAKGSWIDAAIASMLRSNQSAAQCFLAHEATACTDVTGFGLLGHLLEMVRASKLGVKLDLDAVPLLPGALETVRMGIVSSLQPQNAQAAGAIANLETVRDRAKFLLLFDPQTSGGLLAAVPLAQVDRCLATLKRSGDIESAVIGWTLPFMPAEKPITIG